MSAFHFPNFDYEVRKEKRRSPSRDPGTGRETSDPVAVGREASIDVSDLLGSILEVAGGETAVCVGGGEGATAANLTHGMRS